jgi:DNA-binding transcriptional MerR regulator
MIQEPHCPLTLDHTPDCIVIMETKNKSRMVRMQIGELARLTALTVDAIRFYEKRRLLPEPIRSTGRFRLYAPDDMERLRFIQQMQGLGFSLTEIGELIDLRTRKVDACQSVQQLLKGKLAGVRAKKQKLQQLESELMVDLHKCKQELRRRRRHAAHACPMLEVTGVVE